MCVYDDKIKIKRGFHSQRWNVEKKRRRIIQKVRLIDTASGSSDASYLFISLVSPWKMYKKKTQVESFFHTTTTIIIQRHLFIFITIRNYLVGSKVYNRRRFYSAACVRIWRTKIASRAFTSYFCSHLTRFDCARTLFTIFRRARSSRISSKPRVALARSEAEVCWKGGRPEPRNVFAIRNCFRPGRAGRFTDFRGGCYVRSMSPRKVETLRDTCLASLEIRFRKVTYTRYSN